MTRWADSHAMQINEHHSAASENEGPPHTGNTLESYVLPKRLRMDDNDIHFLTSGMEVIKVSKNGNQQRRRIAIASNNRAIYITTNRTQSRVLSRLKGRTNPNLAHATGTSVTCKEINLSMIVRMQLGQQSRRFEKARTKSSKQLFTNTAIPVDTQAYSLSIIYRRSNVRDNFVNTNNSRVLDNGEDSLDLIIPSKEDYDALARAIEDLLVFYKEVEPSTSPLFGWVQYHLVDMGKRLGTDHNGVVVKGGVSCSDWISLCRRWNAPVTKADATLLYDTYCNTFGKPAQADRPAFHDIVKLLHVLQQWITENQSTEANLVDPRKELFERVARSKPLTAAEKFVKGVGDKTNNVPSISAATFLDFLHSEQKEINPTLHDIKDLFAQLNGYQNSNDLDIMPTVDGVIWEREYISWDCFARYILLESNDVFDPKRSAHSERSMSEPLSNYWINTSHDTYLRRTNSSPGQKYLDFTDLQSYTNALYRGARAIEIDVWDGPNGTIDPVVRSGVSSFADETAPIGAQHNAAQFGHGLIYSDVLSTVRNFLQSEPNSYPIILLIENHCSLAYQEKMASDINGILGKANILYKPDSLDVESLPSPSDLKGKVIIKSKRSTGSVLNDDFDDENIAASSPSYTDYDSEDDLEENVIGFKSTGTIKSAVHRHMSLEELLHTAQTESLESNSAKNRAYNEFMDAKALEKQTRRHADALLQDIGMSYKELKAKREKGGDCVLGEGTEIELCQDGARVKEFADLELEIVKSFAESVEESRLVSNAANVEARSEYELFEVARADLMEMEKTLSGLRESLQRVIKRNSELKEAAERALVEARINREFADDAQSRVASVKTLLDKSHEQAVSSETVANTADTEAKISTQRASDAESRAKKARIIAEEEKKKAEHESKIEDDLESQIAFAMTKLKKALKSVEIAENQADKVDPMKGVLTDKLSQGTDTRKLSIFVEDISRKLKVQAKTANTARKQADHSISIADQLEELALEEREAANLRCTASEKAMLSFKRSGQVMHSTEKQLAEAERAAHEASDLAVLSRKNAEILSNELKYIQDSSSLKEIVEKAKQDRDTAYLTYKNAKESKERADHQAAKAKKAFEKDCMRLKSMEREVMTELLSRESAQQAEVLAITACENAHMHRDLVRSSEQTYKNAAALSKEKAGAFEIAMRYKDKMIRVQPLSKELAKLTVFNSCKHKNWNKSLSLHVCDMHSIPNTKVVERAEKGKNEWSKWVQFNKTHIIRTFPETASRNYNPLLPWALGCQCVSMNFIYNQFMLLNDGRFRENGNQGYVLKPEYLCNTSVDKTTVDDAMNCKHPRIIKIQVLSGYFIPKSEESKSSGRNVSLKRSISPFVRVTLYDGSPATFLEPPTHSTAVVKGNGLNPVWNDEEKKFPCLNPSVGMLLISVHDHCDIAKRDLFIGASSIPVSCLREGYRSVSLYDSNNTRSGAMRFASLFIKVTIEV